LPHIRFGSYRILYTVSDRVRIVAVLKIAQRSEAYR
jgi:mRNA-degrading endonuclease RelE of RelBE toxin-antitoxin system